MRKISVGGLAGMVIIAVIVAAALLAPVLPIRSPLAVSLAARMQPPGATHVLGTDQLGRDIMSRTLYGARVSLSIVGVAMLLAAAIGIPLGLVSGFVGGLLDRVLMRLVDLQLAFPLMLLALTVIVVLGPTVFNLVAVLTLAGWVRFARVVRGEVLALREREFVLAARAAGASNLRLMFRHILPGVAGPIFVIGTLELARMILLESSLSFLGLGTQPPDPSWGRMLADGRSYLANAWWIATIPGVAIMLTVLSVNLVGDHLRDRFDPRGERL